MNVFRINYNRSYLLHIPSKWTMVEPDNGQLWLWIPMGFNLPWTSKFPEDFCVLMTWHTVASLMIFVEYDKKFRFFFLKWWIRVTNLENNNYPYYPIVLPSLGVLPIYTLFLCFLSCLWVTVRGHFVHSKALYDIRRFNFISCKCVYSSTIRLS